VLSSAAEISHVVLLIEMFSVVKIRKKVNCEKEMSNFTPKSKGEKIKYKIILYIQTDNKSYSWRTMTIKPNQSPN